MALTAFLRLGCVLLLLAFGLSATRCLYADEAPVTASEPKEAAFGSAADQGRLAWTILEAIEQHHIAPPPRQALVKVITRAIAGIKKDARVDPLDKELLERLDAEILQCKSADEMADISKQMESLHPDFDRVIADLTSGFDEILGEFHLIHAKDHNVEEQFRSNRYVGLGVMLRMNNDPSQPPVFAHIVPGGAADRGGLTPNTFVHEIDGRPTENVPQEKILDWLRGPSGSDVTLTVSTDQSAKQRVIILTRGVVRFDSLKDHNHQSLNRDRLRYDRREPIGWITVNNIHGSTLQEFRVAEQHAKEDGIRALVLDFRSWQRFSDLHQALLIADSFLDGGVIWEQSDRSRESRVENADRECLFREIPLVVLIDPSTGPTHCAIAAALQDAGRALLVGDSPEFNGLISSTVRLNGVPYSLTLNTTRLTRARRDRQWPLVPDVPASDAKKATVTYVIQTGQRVLLQLSSDPTPAIVSKTPTLIDSAKTGSPASLIEQPLKRSIEPNVVRRQGPTIRPMLTQQPNDEFPLQPAQMRQQIDELAIRVARNLLDQTSPGSPQTVSDSPNQD